MSQLLMLVTSYLVGCISGSYILGKLFYKKDIRNYGSGNAGTTNAMRVFGKKFGIITFLIDFIKGAVLILILKFIFKLDNTKLLLASLFCILGHDFPFNMNFKGGKGVATTLGTFAIFNFLPTLISVVFWIIFTLIFNTASISSIAFFILLFLINIYFKTFSDFQVILLIIVVSIGIFRHNSNIYRLITGKENKIGAKKR